MKVWVIGSGSAVWGFALTGVGGDVVTSAEDLSRALDRALARDDLGILLITDDVAEMDRSRVDRLIMESEQPLVVEIPGPKGPVPGRPSIQQMLRRTIGVKV
ncbi:MAG TPA: ATPase [Chloroflexi bacterium]|nr:ATPase [Chloroflexota bacterium]